MQPPSVDIVQAQSGFFTIIDFPEDREVEVAEPVVAWRIETYAPDEDRFHSECVPLTVDGEPAANCIGVQNPDMTVTVFEDSSYQSVEELQKQRYPGT